MCSIETGELVHSHVGWKLLQLSWLMRAYDSVHEAIFVCVVHENTRTDTERETDRVKCVCMERGGGGGGGGERR